MNLKLRSIAAPGDLNKERITLRVLSSLDVGDYLVAQTVLLDDFPTTNFDHTFWFPYKQVEKGDLVVVYTKSGRSKEKALSRGNSAHFFYMDLKSPIWNESNKGAIILHTPIWESKSLGELRR